MTEKTKHPLANVLGWIAEGVKVGTLIRKKANQFLDEQINSIPAK